jgi:GNAT superfamily N-acetyltransferase
MTFRVRTSVDDRLGVLAKIARACGEADVNILGMQVFPGQLHVIDEFVVAPPEGWSDLDVAQLFESAGGKDVAVTREQGQVEPDPATRYLAGVRAILEDGRPADAVLRELLSTAPPDVANYSGHDVLDLVRSDGSTLRIMRAVPFTAAEKARAQALLAIVGDAGRQLPLIAPLHSGSVPIVRAATLADLDSIAALHARCSADTLYRRYQAPLQMPMTARMVRRLLVPEAGVALVAQCGLEVVGHALVESFDQAWNCELIVEDAWQGRGIGTMLVKSAAAHAKSECAERMTFITAGSNDRLLKVIGAAGFVARVERHQDRVHITVPLSGIRAASAS